VTRTRRIAAPDFTLARLLPPLVWLRGYSLHALVRDVMAGFLTTLVSVPQGMAFALLAGLPPEQGLFAGIIPPLAYALLGTSRTLLVGPVSVTAIMLAHALSRPELSDHGTYLSNALVLGFESGCVLVLLALLRLGALVNFISHPVLIGFTSGAALLIVIKQLPALLGAPSLACGFDQTFFNCAVDYLSQVNRTTVIIGCASIVLMGLWNEPLGRVLKIFRVWPLLRLAITKSGPILVVLAGCFAVSAYDLRASRSVATVGDVPASLPQLSLAFLNTDTWLLLLPSAFYIGLIGYVSSVAMAKVTANMRREKIDPGQEALSLGVANIVAACSASMPVAAGMGQTMLKVSAGAETQMATLVTSALVGASLVYLSPWFALIPKATLAGIILVAILPLIAFGEIAQTWRYQRDEGAAALVTLLGVLFIGMEKGLLTGIAVTLLGYLWRTGHPHIAVVGRVPHTEHFRNVLRHRVQTWPAVSFIRIDENLSFANMGVIEDFITSLVNRDLDVEHVVIIATAISHVDATALEALENLTITLRAAGVTLHLAEVKGPVMDDLKRTKFLDELKPGQIFFRTEEAVEVLTGDAGPFATPTLEVGKAQSG
jgi:SulP family sulfate permease